MNQELNIDAKLGFECPSCGLVFEEKLNTCKERRDESGYRWIVAICPRCKAEMDRWYSKKLYPVEMFDSDWQEKREQEEKNTEKGKEKQNNTIVFPTFNVSFGMAVDIFKNRLQDESIPFETRILAIEKVADLETHNSITKKELVNALRWIFEHYDFSE